MAASRRASIRSRAKPTTTRWPPILASSAGPRPTCSSSQTSVRWPVRPRQGLPARARLVCGAARHQGSRHAAAVAGGFAAAGGRRLISRSLALHLALGLTAAIEPIAQRPWRDPAGPDGDRHPGASPCSLAPRAWARAQPSLLARAEIKPSFRLTHDFPRPTRKRNSLRAGRARRIGWLGKPARCSGGGPLRRSRAFVVAGRGRLALASRERMSRCFSVARARPRSAPSRLGPLPGDAERQRRT